MNKKGFTLIELLAVIVVLAIIALIATPLVMNTIKTAQEGADARSVEGYMKAYESAIYKAKLADPEFNMETDTPTITTDDYSGAAVTCNDVDVSATGKVSATGCQVAGSNATYNYTNGSAKKA